MDETRNKQCERNGTKAYPVDVRLKDRKSNVTLSNHERRQTFRCVGEGSQDWVVLEKVDRTQREAFRLRRHDREVLLARTVMETDRHERDNVRVRHISSCNVRR